jgi:hypothetical protein
LIPQASSAVDTIWCFISQRLVQALVVVLLDVTGNVNPGIPGAVVFLKINLLLFQAFPSSFDVNIVITAGF